MNKLTLCFICNTFLAFLAFVFAAYFSIVFNIHSSMHFTYIHKLLSKYLLLLRAQNIDHRMKLRSKRGGTLPFVELNGVEIADSTYIMKELEKKFEKNLDASLSPEQRNLSHAMLTLVENHLVWQLFWWRAKHPEDLIKGYKVNFQNALGIRLPNSVLNFFFKFSYARKVCG